MSTKSIFLLLFTFLLICGCSSKIQDKITTPKIQSCENSIQFWVEDELKNNPDLNVEEFKEYIMHTYCGEEILENAKILTNNGYKSNIEYIKDGKTFHGPYISTLRSSVDWIKENIEDDAIITCLWDYGAMIRGLAQKEVVVAGPSKEIIEDRKKSNPEYKTIFKEYELTSHSILTDVAQILVTEDTQDAVQLMKKYNSQYLLITQEDVYKSSAINRWAVGNYNQPSENAVIFQALSKDLQGFELIYSNDEIVIFKII